MFGEMIRVLLFIICFLLTWTVKAQIDNKVVPNDTIEKGYYSLEQCEVLSKSFRGGEVIESLLYNKNSEF